MSTWYVSLQTIFNVKRRYLSEGLDSALFDKARSGRPGRIDGTQRPQITETQLEATSLNALSRCVFVVNPEWTGSRELGVAEGHGEPKLIQSSVVKEQFQLPRGRSRQSDACGSSGKLPDEDVV